MVIARHGVVTMLKMFIVFFTYKQQGEKKPGPIRQFRIYANNTDEARSMASNYANYPDIDIVRIKPV